MLLPRRLGLYGLVLVIALVSSGLNPYDRATWWMEVMPVLLALPLLACTWRRYPLSDLLYGLIFVHCLILIFGGEYSYARVPLGYWLQDIFGASRNPYDKIGHFAQGLVPAMIAREVFVQGAYVNGKAMLGFVCICVAMAISAWYELIEWAAALILGQGADEFLGTQGDPWDTQSDMFMAFLGATFALLLLGRWHDRQLARLQRAG